MATARSSLTCGFVRPATRVNTSPIASSPTMNATRGHVTRLRRAGRLGSGAAPPVEDPGSEGKIAGEVEEERELEPPRCVAPVHPLLPRLDKREVEREEPREQQDDREEPEQPEDQH